LANAALIPEARWLLDRYDFLAELGRGGMGIVYLGQERSSGRQVAIKLLGSLHTGNAEAALRFAREARTAAALEHPNIVRTLAIEELSGGAIALVSEYVPGQTLRALLHETGPLRFERTAAVLRDVAAALAHAHQSRIVHRDVKPENIFIERASGRALLADFGIARPLDTDTQLTAAGSALGTPSYMAPEQVKGGRVDERADVYSLGLVGWEMLTGARPWQGETLYDVLHKQQHERLPSLAALRPDIPTYLLLAIEGALSKLASERWSGGAELQARLTPTPAALPPRRAFDDRSWAEAETIPFLRSASAVPATVEPAVGTDAHSVGGMADEEPTLEDLPAGGLPAPVTASGAAASRPGPKIGVRGPLLTALVAALLAMVMLPGGKDRLRAGWWRLFTREPSADSAMPSQVAARDTASGRLASDELVTRPETTAAAIEPPRVIPPRASPPRVSPPRVSPPPASPRPASPAKPTPRSPTPPRVATQSAPAATSRATTVDARCGTPTRGAQRACLLAEIDRNDADLTNTYQALIAQLRREADGRREPPAVQALRVEQRAWIVQRERACRSTPNAGSGPLWGAERVPCFARRSGERDAVLQLRLQRRTARDS